MDFNTPFKKELEGKFLEKKLSPNSIKLYLRNLEKLNGDMPLKNLTFLKDIPAIQQRLEKYKENTKRGYLISVTSALGTDKSTKQKQKLYDDYFKLMMEKNKELKAEESKNEPSQTQKDNWLKWEDVVAKFNELQDKVNSFKNQKEINEANYNILLQYLILSLYTFKPPRRNEYQKINIVKTVSDTLPTDRNYLDLDKRQFIFNVFKTSKKEGKQKEDIPDELFSPITTYLKFHPAIKGKKPVKATNTPFLVYYDGRPLDKVNSITRILNKIFGKAVGSSMLRHIYLSSKYGEVNEAQKRDAQAMGHSVEMARDYIKKWGAVFNYFEN